MQVKTSTTTAPAAARTTTAKSLPSQRTTTKLPVTLAAAASTRSASVTQKVETTTSVTVPQTSTSSRPKVSSSTKTTTMMMPRTTSTRKPATRQTTAKVLIENTNSPAPSTQPPPPPTKLIQATKATTTLVEPHQVHKQRLPVLFDANILPDKQIIESAVGGGDDTDDDNEDTLPNLEIIPFVAHDAIDKSDFEPYPALPRKPYDNLEKDYFAASPNDKLKEKPFRYNNKFIHNHDYDDSADYVYTNSNPHERIDNGPYYYETNENQFDSFSPPKEQDFLGKKFIHIERA